MSGTIKIGRVTYDKPADDWTAYVMKCIQEKTLAAAGKELALLVDFALMTKHSEQFNRDVRACTLAFWDRCDTEKKGEA